jgi:hypothetical protein
MATALPSRLRAEAERIEGLIEEVEARKKALREEARFLELKPTKGVVEPWDARKTFSGWGYEASDGITSKPSRIVTGKAWGELCRCPNVATAKFVAKAVNDYLRRNRSEITRRPLPEEREKEK